MLLSTSKRINLCNGVMNDQFDIRIGSPEDAEIFAKLGAQTFDESFGHLYAPKDLNAFLADNHTKTANARMLGDPAYRLWLVEDGDARPVGYGVGGPCDLPVPDLPEGSGELVRLYLLKEAYGKGVGSALLEEVLAWLRENFEHNFVSVYAKNYGAQRLYARYGFVKIHEYDFMVGSHADPEWIMKLA